MNFFNKLITVNNCENETFKIIEFVIDLTFQHDVKLLCDIIKRRFN